MSRFWAARIRWAIWAARTPGAWPCYPLTPVTRRAFDRTYKKRWTR